MKIDLKKATFKARSKDDEVKDINDVVINSIEVEEKAITWTLAGINHRISELETELLYYNKIKEKVEIEAKKVKLK